jgi:maltose alpha-D-glucosyltransferase / alpha-amylase
MVIQDLWYKNAVIYHLDLATYMDANGDGVGDFEGLVNRLDYLKALGVDAIWLSPFQISPNRDNGYDIADYYEVDARHGTNGDFVEFTHQAKHRGFKVLMDLVVNHTSDEHPWFQKAREDENSPYRDWYVWAKDRPPDWNKGMVFPGVQESTWTYDKEAGLYYFHRFYEFQPDLNINNPKVREEITKIIGFWLQLGVVGFRVDGVPFIIEIPKEGGGEPERHFEHLYDMRNFLQWRSGDAILLGEANVLPHENAEYFGERGNGLHMMFNFMVNQKLFYGLASGDPAPLAEALEATRELPPAAQWGHFLRNHDELDLGRLTEEQRERVYAEFGPEEHMRAYGRGLRRRLAPMLKDRRRIELAFSLMFSLPGTPVIYYGDEIGMGENLDLNERDSVRTPMQWGNELNGGFSVNSKTFRPVIKEGSYGYPRVNVHDQRRDPHSLLNWFANLIRLRKECPEIGWGKWEIIQTRSPHVLSLKYDWLGSAVLAVHNLSGEDQRVEIRPEVERGERLENLMVDESSTEKRKGVHELTLKPYEYRWYRAGTIDRVMERIRP